MSKSGDWFIRENPEDDDSGYDEWLMKKGYEQYLEEVKMKEIKMGLLEDKRNEAIKYVEDVWEQIRFDEGDNEECMHSLKLHDAIWYASTEILPSLEVQAVIDSRNNIYVSTGTPGYVDYLTIDPSTLIGMKLPIRCWVHTHPFGSAYFSGTDWRTISIWKENMYCAYVLGSQMSTKGHYGFWSSIKKNELEIYVNGEPEKIQTTQFRGEEE